METNEEKYCPKCEDKKPLEEFYKNRSKKNGVSGYCKICDKQEKKEFYVRSNKFKGVLNFWTDAEVAYLLENYEKADMADMLAALPGRTALRIRQKAIYMGISGKRQAYQREQAKLKPKVKRVYPPYKPKEKQAKPKKEKLPKPKKEKYVKTYHRELPRFVEKKFTTREVKVAELELVKIDRRTQIYLKKDLSQEERNVIIERYARKAIAV